MTAERVCEWCGEDLFSARHAISGQRMWFFHDAPYGNYGLLGWLIADGKAHPYSRGGHQRPHDRRQCQRFRDESTRRFDWQDPGSGLDRLQRALERLAARAP